MRVLFYDCETNGTDPVKDEVVETAGLLWSVDHASTVSGFTLTHKVDTNAAESVNGISPALLRDCGTAPVEAWKRVEAWMMRADVVVAHNASFDRSFCPHHLQAMRPWVCTQDDVDWPRPCSTNGIVALLLAHGLGVSHAHRALVDVMSLARLFERCAELGHAPADLLAKAMRPKRRYKAVTGRFDPGLNAKLKEHGFRWDPDRKEWWRRLAVEDVPTLQAKYPFSIVDAP
jgi:DNA polymerase III subunit epsilon